MVFTLIALILFAVAAVGLAIQRSYWLACLAAGLAVLELGAVAPGLG